MKKKLAAKAIALAVLSTYIAGCSTLTNYKNNASDYAVASASVNSIFNKKQEENPFVVHDSNIYVDTSPMSVSDEKSNLLETFPGEIVISRASGSLMTIRQIADKITQLTKIPVSYSDSLGVKGQAVQASDPMSAKKITGTDPLGIAEPLPGGDSINMQIDSLIGASAGSPDFPMETPQIDAEFSGKLTDFLDLVAGRMGLFWKFDYVDKRIIFYKHDTKTFALSIMPGSISSDSTLTNTTTTGSSGSGSGSSSSSSAGQTVEMRSSSSVWDQTLKTIQKMASIDGKVEGNEGMGIVVVTDTPMALANIGRYVNEINTSASRQVSFEVAIYDVELNSENNIGINWDSVWQEAGKFSIGYSAASVAAASISSGVSFLANFGNSSGTNGPQFGKGVAGPVMIKALETQGKVSLKTRQSTMTINNTPAPIKVADENTYIASASSGLNNNSNASGSSLTTTITPGKALSGITMTLLPKIFDANQLMLQMAMDISAVELPIKMITVGTSGIQVPKISTRSILQRIGMKSGETLILSGFDQEKNSTSSDGSLGIPSGWGVGSKHIVTVVMVTPRITEGLTSIAQ